MTAAERTTGVGLYLYDQVELLDFAGPYEVFTTAARLARRDRPAAPDRFRVESIARRPGPVTARAGLRLEPSAQLDDHPPLDLLIVPGGVVDGERRRPEVARWIAAVAGTATVTASVCTGAFLLADAGLLTGRAATTHWEDLEGLRSEFPQIEVRGGVRFVDAGSVVTAAGIAAGIDMALHLVGRLAGRPLAARTARQMEVDGGGAVAIP